MSSEKKTRENNNSTGKFDKTKTDDRVKQLSKNENFAQLFSGVYYFKY